MPTEGLPQALDWLVVLGYVVFLFVVPVMKLDNEYALIAHSYLCAPETKCYRAPSTVANFLCEQSRIRIILRE